MPLLDVRDLSVAFDTDEGRVDVIDQVNLQLESGETLGVVGESGCGKSVTALAIMGLLPRPSGRITNGQIVLDNQDLLSKHLDERRRVRGRRISMIFQEPMTALNPVQRIGKQLVESVQLHRPDVGKDESLEECVKILEQVGISEPEQRLMDYPHQLSGGMRQRVMIAMALIHVPDILIADEPTTALDVTIQAQILELIAKLQQENGMAVIFITHDLAVIAELADRVSVMYAGRVVEQSTVTELFSAPLHPYTQGLLNSIPKLEGTPKTQLETIPGLVPSYDEMPSGCRFRNRCNHAQTLCGDRVPSLESESNTHHVACHYWGNLSERIQ
ncbi:MAG: ABC transporter ATP-binding protein [Gammaproteobacteria bacterium]|nr:ABC transporter ATP-binding protein [Gammaproteobacteria bacterium]MYD79699.1 ABC transporter ATP-binding protein [Gammaproteobacteria bacterium]